MYQYMAKGKFDTVICTHVLSAVMLPHMHKPFPLALKTAMIMTDYTCYPGMEATDLQMYFIPDGSLPDETGRLKRDRSGSEETANGVDQCIRLLQSERKLKEMEKALREYRRAEGARQIFETMELLDTAKIYWKDTAYVERESNGLPQVPTGQIKYTRV